MCVRPARQSLKRVTRPELRLLVRLRLQNPNDAAVDYDGVYLQLDVQDKTFATGVSDKGGTLPAFGESLISVPVSVSAMRMARQFTGMLDGTPVVDLRPYHPEHDLPKAATRDGWIAQAPAPAVRLKPKAP